MSSNNYVDLYNLKQKKQQQQQQKQNKTKKRDEEDDSTCMALKQKNQHPYWSLLLLSF